MQMQDEMVVIVDDSNRIAGAEPRSKMRALRLPHRATYILVFNSQGDLFVQKRTQTKDVFPGYFDVVTGGVVQEGETYEESACRELEEELGIRGVALKDLFEFSYEDEISRVWGRAYECIYDGKIILQEEEVESGSFHKISEILRVCEHELFTPDGVYVLKRYLDTKNSVTST